MPRKEITKSQLKRPLQRPRPASSEISPTPVKIIQRRNLQEPSTTKLSSHPPSPKASAGHGKVIKSSGLPAGKHGEANRKLDWLMKVFFGLGVLFFAVYVGLRINQEIQLSIVTPQISSEQHSKKETANPTQIVISKIGIDLPIEETVIKNGIWQISANGASHLTISAKPNEEGTIIMYGHNTTNRFGPIRWLTKGDKIELKTSDGKKYTYVIAKTMKVSPDRMEIFKQKGETLILYTCDGFADLQRFVVIAKKK
jgi:LPXTG-site transpeptidase (sortase) family protein